MQGLQGDSVPQRVYICDSSHAAELKRILEYDPYLDKSLNEEQIAKLKGDEEANVIFARQDYQLRDGIAAGLDRGKVYLYINANDAFLEKADAKLRKSIEGISRAPQEDEEKVIAEIETEISESEQGLGMIFG
jgi:hypothetical protein